MKYLKYFENNNIQQPFFLRFDRLFISFKLAKEITPFNSIEDKGKNKYREYTYQKNIDFFEGTKKEWISSIGGKYNSYVASQANTNTVVRYNGNHAMNIIIKRGTHKDNEHGRFEYYISGHSGDYEMHGKNMIIATRECNLNFMIKLYPIVEHIKNFYKIFKNGDKVFLDIIKDALDKDIILAQYGIPKEIKHLFDTETEDAVKNSFKYNL